MPITGRFVADFTDFQSAVQKAEVSLKGLESNAGKVGGALNKMVDSFSGRKLIQDANLVVESVQRLGGASQLTAAEQLKVNKTVTEAIEKYAALGQQAPQALRELAAATAATLKPMSSLDDHLQGIQKHLSAFSGDKIIQEANQMARAVAELGGASKLTATEQAKVNAVVTEAVAKYAALGRTAPVALQQLAAATKATAGPMSSLEDHLKQIQKHASAFSGDKIIQEAAQIASAVEKVGGASKLTAAEQANVNRTVTEALAKYRALGQQAPQTLTDLAKATTAVQTPTSLLTRTFGELGTQIKATALGFISAQAIIGAVQTGFRLLTDFVSSSVESFAASEAASRKLEAALKSQGNTTPDLARKYAQLAGEFQRSTVFADELVTEMQALLVQVGDVGPQQMERALTAATDLAAGLGIDLRTATMLVGKAFEGETGTLKKYGIVIDETTLKTQGITAVLDAVQDKFGGQAQSEINTYAGAVKQLANAWDDLKEKVGEFIVQQPALQVALTKAMELLRGQTGGTEQLTTATDRQAKAWYGARTGLGVFIDGMRDGLRVLNDVAIGMDHLRLTAEMLARTKPPKTFAAEFILDDKGLIDFAKLQAEFNKHGQVGLDLFMRLRQEAENLTQQGLKPLTKEQRELTLQFTKAGKSAGDIAAKFGVSEIAVKKYLEAVKDGEKAHKDLEAAMEKAAKTGVEAFQKERKAIADVQHDMKVFIAEHLQNMGERAIKTLSAATDGTNAWVRALDLGIPIIKGLGKELKNVGEDIEISFKPVTTVFEDMRNMAEGFAIGLRQLGQAVGGIFGGILQGASTALSSFADLNDATDAYRRALYNAQQAGKSTFALTAQYALQATAAVVGYAQTAISVIERMYDSLTGKEAQAALLARGGLHQFRTDAALAGSAFKDLPNTAAAFRFEIARLDKVIAENSDRMQRYNLTWQDLRRDLRQVQVDQFARTLILDFRAIERQIGSTQDTLKTMGPALSDLVVQAVKTGTKIPKALQPILEQLIKMGGLTEAAARAMLGMQESTMPALADIKDAAERYGLTLDQLGPKVKQLEITETAQQIVKDFDLLVASGADVGVVMGAMKEHVQKLVTAALKAGLELPSSMKPLIQAMIDAGLLTDDTGKKLTDMGNLQFAKPLSERFDELIAKLSDLIDALSKVGTAAEEGFGRARGAAEALGRAIPRGSVPGAPEPGTGTPGAPAIPRPEGPGGPPSNQDDRSRVDDDGGAPPGPPGRKNPNPSTADIAAMMASARAPEFAESQSFGRVLPFPSPALTPAEAALTAPRSAAAGGSQAPASPTTIIIEVDSRTLAEIIVPELPGAARRYVVG